jgi:putative transposase
MARLPRLYVAGCLHHIIQRGNNRDACFFEEKDYAFYLQQLKISAEQCDVAIHPFVLMTNHVHLLVWGGNRKSKQIKVQESAPSIALW